MQPSTSLIAVGISAVIAISSIETAAAQPASLVPPHQTNSAVDDQQSRTDPKPPHLQPRPKQVSRIARATKANQPEPATEPAAPSRKPAGQAGELDEEPSGAIVVEAEPIDPTQADPAEAASDSAEADATTASPDAEELAQDRPSSSSTQPEPLQQTIAPQNQEPQPEAPLEAPLSEQPDPEEQAGDAAVSQQDIGQAAPETAPAPEIEGQPQLEQPQPQDGAQEQPSPLPQSGEQASPPDTVGPPATLDQRQLEQLIQQQQTDFQVIPPSQRAPGQPSQVTPTPPPPETIQTLPSAINQSGRRGSPANTAPAPEYLNPSPNPLDFPTRPEEVGIIGTQPLTLQQAIELAIRNNPTVQQARIQLAQAQAQLREAQAANFPTVSATSNFTQSGQQTSQAQQSLVPNDQGGFSFQQGDAQTQYVDSTSLGAALQVDYTVFNSGRTSALIRAQERQVRSQQLNVETQLEDLILTVKTDYYDLQQSGENVRIAQASVAASEQSLRDSIALERAGVGTYFDVLQAQVQLANDRQTLISNLSQLEIDRRTLVQDLNLASTVDVATADPVEVAGIWELTLEDTIVQAFKNRSELENQLVQREIAQANRRAALAQLGPQLGLTGSFGLNNDLDQDAGFLYNYSIAAQLSLTLFDGGAARAQANQQEANIALAESQFEAQRNQIRFQVEQAYSQLQANFQNIQTTALAVQQAQESLRLARLRFQAGVGTQTDVLNQQQALTQAEVNNVTAILNYNRALATLQRQVSNLPEGFLNDVP